jgi:hypothetical protein
MKLLNRRKKQPPPRLWSEFDSIPIDKFRKIVETGDLKHLLIEGELTENHVDLFNKTWESIYDEYISHFGLGKNRERIMKQERKVALLKIQRWLKDDKSLMTIIAMEERKLEDLKTKDKLIERASFEFSVAVIQKSVVSFSVKETTAKQFYTYVEIHQKAQDQMRVDRIKNAAS